MKTSEIYLCYDLAILLGIEPGRVEAGVHIKTYTAKFMAVLLGIARNNSSAHQ